MAGEIITEYGKDPVNWGKLKEKNFSHKEKNISCGEEIEVDFVLGENDMVEKIAFEAEGRLVTIAAMSLLTEELEDEPLKKIEEYSKEDILELLEVETLSPRRLKSALLGLLTLKNAYRSRKNTPLLDFGDVMEE